MSENNPNDPLGSESKTKVVHIGVDRFRLLTNAAIDISHQTRRQITASQVNKYLIDHFAQEAVQRLKSEHEAERAT